MKCKLIVFEGTDGFGKATQTAMLCQHLERVADHAINIAVSAREESFHNRSVHAQV